MQRILTFSSTKNNSVFVIFMFESLTNAVVNFEQLGPDLLELTNSISYLELTISCRAKIRTE